jgi:hypothetical protein
VGSRFLTIALALALSCLPCAARSAPVQQQWIVVSNVRFDPLADAALIAQLQAAPPERWRTVFSGPGPQTFAGYASETNYPLLESSLEAMRNAVADPPVVIVAGDLLAAGLHAKFVNDASSHDDASYQAFVDKTVAFLAQEFHAAFPRSLILPVVGANDGYCGLGQSGTNTPFLANAAAAFSAGAGGQDPLGFVTQFRTGGYYDVALPGANARALVVNTTFWSAGFRDACAKQPGKPGDDEFSWLLGRFKADAGSPLWVVGYLPPGIDAAASLATKNVVPYLEERANASYIAALSSQAPPVVMALAGSSHMNSYRIIGPQPSDARTPMLLVPAISPDASNNPAFEVLDVDGAAVTDAQVWVLQDLAEHARDARAVATWRREYDFDAIFGHGPITAEHLSSLQAGLFANDRLRRRYGMYYDSGSGRVPVDDRNWRAYWCAHVALTVTSYAACAMPAIERNLPGHPSPPPLPAPSPSPSPSPH